MLVQSVKEAYVKPCSPQEYLCFWKVGESAESSLPLSHLKEEWQHVRACSYHPQHLEAQSQGPLVSCCFCSAVSRAMLTPFHIITFSLFLLKSLSPLFSSSSCSLHNRGVTHTSPGGCGIAQCDVFPALAHLNELMKSLIISWWFQAGVLKCCFRPSIIKQQSYFTWTAVYLKQCFISKSVVILNIGTAVIQA